MQVSAPEQLKLDSVELLMLDSDYGQLRSLGKQPLGQHDAVYRGLVDSANVAMLRFTGSDSIFYFILEPTLTTVQVAKTTVTVWGGNLNKAYFDLVAQRQAAIERRNAYWQEYARHLADTTLTLAIERRLWLADSLQRERLQAATVQAINRPDAVGKLYHDRFFSTLDTLHARQVTRR